MEWIASALVILLMVIAAVYLILFWLIKPTKTEHQLDCLRFAPVAHRGLHDVTKNDPENSLKAFQQAVDAGYSIETDLWLTKDGVPIAFHDGVTKRLCGVEGHVEDMTLEEVKQLRILGTDATIPTLEEVLAKVDGRVSLLIEMKRGKNEGLEEAAFFQLCRYRGRYAVQSFSPESMAWFKTHAPLVLRGQLSANFMKCKEMPFFRRFAMTHLLVNVISRPHFVSYDKSGIRRYEVKAIRKMHGVLFAWTVNQPAEEERLSKYVDNIIFERFVPEKKGTRQ